MQPIGREHLRPWTWYVGRGRNGNVGLWNGEDFLVITALNQPGVKVEPYYVVEGGCFQPFRAIEEGMALDTIVEDGGATRYATSLIFAHECQEEHLGTLDALRDAEYILIGRAALDLQSPAAVMPADISLLVPGAAYSSVVHQLKTLATPESVGEQTSSFRRPLSRVSLLRLDDETYGRLSGFKVTLDRGPNAVNVLKAAAMLGLYGQIRYSCSDWWELEVVVLDVIDSLREDEHGHACHVMRELGVPDPEDSLCIWLDRAARRRWSYSESVASRRAARERVTDVVDKADR